MEIEVASGSWRHGLVLSVRCGEVRRQAPLQHDTRILFPQDGSAMKQMQVDVFAKLGTDHFIVDPRRELYNLSIVGEDGRPSDVALRVRQPEEACGELHRCLGGAQATDEYIEQSDLRQSCRVPPQQYMKQSPRAPSEPDSACAGNPEDRLQKMRQDAVEYAERFDLRTVLQDMFQQVIKERPENPFEFMQDFMSNNNSVRPSCAGSVRAASVEPGAEQDNPHRLLELERQLQEAKEALAKSALEAKAAVDAASRREQECRQHLALAEVKAASEAHRADFLQQRLQDLAPDPGSPSSPSAESQAALAAKHEAAAARENALAQDLRAAAAKVQETLAEQAKLQARCSEAENCREMLEQKIRDLEAKAEIADASTEASSGVEGRTRSRGSCGTAMEVASTRTPESDREMTLTPEALTRCTELQQRCSEAECERDELRRQLSDAQARRDELRRQLSEAEAGAARTDAELQLASDQATAMAEARRRCAELERHLGQSEANMAAQRDTAGMLRRRIQELEAAAAAHVPAAAERTELSRSNEQELDSLRTQVEVLQRRIQAYETQANGSGLVAASAALPHQASQSDEAAGGEAAKTAGSLPPSRTGAGAVNTHMLSQLMASTYAPPVPLMGYAEPREDAQVEPPPPNPALLVEIVDCKDEMSNGIFAWVGTCSSRPMYRLLGPEPRYLYYAQADIASTWRIVNKMGSEDYIERFRLPSDAKLPVDCQEGDLGGRAIEATLTAEVAQRISTISSQDEKVAIRSKFAEVYGQTFVALEGEGRGLISRASPVVAVAHALEAQQRALQLLHGQLSAETQRREAAEKHANNMEEAFETLQLRLQAQLPGPPSLASLKEVQAQAAIGSLSARGAGDLPAVSKPPSFLDPPNFLDRGFVFEKDGKVDWASDLGPGCGPVAHPPMAPKDRRPMPPPTFRRGLSGLRNSGRESPRPQLAVLPPLATTPRLAGDGAAGPPEAAVC